MANCAILKSSIHQRKKAKTPSGFRHSYSGAEVQQITRVLFGVYPVETSLRLGNIFQISR